MAIYTRSLPGAKIKDSQYPTHGKVRIEASCPVDSVHLAYVFEDGPLDIEIGRRFSINSASINTEELLVDRPKDLFWFLLGSENPCT